MKTKKFMGLFLAVMMLINIMAHAAFAATTPETLLTGVDLFETLDFEQALNDDCFTKDVNGNAVANADPWKVFPATTGITLGSGYASGTTKAAIVEDADKGKVLKLSSETWVNNGLRLTIPYTAPDLTNSTMYVEYDIKMSKAGNGLSLGDMFAFSGAQWSNALPKMRNAGADFINMYAASASDPDYLVSYGFIDDWTHVKMVINKSETEGKELVYSMYVTNSEGNAIKITDTDKNEKNFENIELATALNNALSIQFFQGDVSLDNIKAYTISEFGVDSTSALTNHSVNQPFSVKFNNYVNDTTLNNISVTSGGVKVDDINCTLDDDGQTLLISGNWSYSKEYTVSVTGVEDLYGAVLDSKNISFKTEKYVPSENLLRVDLAKTLDFEQALNDDCFTKDVNGAAVENADPWKVLYTTTGIELNNGYNKDNTKAEIIQDTDKGKILKLTADGWVTNGLRLTIPYTAPDLSKETMHVEYDIKMSAGTDTYLSLYDFMAFSGTQFNTTSSYPSFYSKATTGINMRFNESGTELVSGFMPDEWYHVKMVINNSNTTGKTLKYSIYLTDSENQTISKENIELASALNEKLSLRIDNAFVSLDNIEIYKTTAFEAGQASAAVKNITIPTNNYVDADSLAGITVNQGSASVTGFSAGVTDDFKGIVLKFESPLAIGAEYTVTLNGVCDSFGNAMSTESVKVTFTAEDYEFEDVSAVAGSDITAKVNNNTQEDSDVLIACAIYVSVDNMSMVDCAYFKEVTIPAGESASLPAGIRAESGNVIKVFLFDSATGLKPILPAATLTVQ